MKKIAVIAAHPDDEVLGCGASIARFIAEGHDVHVLIMAEGITARDVVRRREKRGNDLSKLAEMAHKAHNILGSTSLQLLNFPDNRMDTCDRLDVIKEIEKFIFSKQIEIVFTHHIGDVNIDHRRVHEAVMTACRPVPDSTVKQMYFFEVPSSTEWRPAGTVICFEPSYFVDVTSFFSKKMSALKQYDFEMRNFPHSRSYKALESLGLWRGASCGVNFAEAFVTGRIVI